MEVKQLYFVQHDTKVTALYLLNNGRYILDISNQSNKSNFSTFLPLKEKEAKKMIEEAKSGMHGDVLKENK